MPPKTQCSKLSESASSQTPSINHVVPTDSSADLVPNNLTTIELLSEALNINKDPLAEQQLELLIVTKNCRSAGRHAII